MQRIASLAAAAVATLFASAALAQMTGVADAQFETIVSVSPDGSAAVLQDAAGQQRTIMLDQSTTITRQGRPGTSATTIRLGDIGVGDRLVVEGAARQGGFNAQRIQVFGPGVVSAPPPGVVTPPGANPAQPPPSGTGAPNSANPAQPPSGTGAPDGSNPASPPPGSVRPGDPNTATPGGSSANPASPPGGGGAGSNPAAPTTGGAGGAASPM